VNAAMPVMGAEPATDGSPWACLIVLDARQFSTRCRRCGWRSPLCAALTDAQTAFQTHACPSVRSTLRRERQRCQAACGPARTTGGAGRARPASSQERG